MSTTTQHTFKITLIGNIAGGIQGPVIAPERFDTALKAVAALDGIYLPGHRADESSQLHIVDEQGYACSVAFIREKAQQEQRMLDLAKRHEGLLVSA